MIPVKSEGIMSVFSFSGAKRSLICNYEIE